MATILQQRTSGFCKVSPRQRELAKISWNDDSVTSTKMGRRDQNDKTQKSFQAERELTSQDNVDKRLRERQRRRKAKSPSTKQNTSQYSSTQEQSEAKPHLVAAAVDRKEYRVQQQQGPHKEQKHTGPRRSRRAPAPHISPLSEPCPDLPKVQTPNPETVKLSERVEGNIGSDSDLSELERLPVPSSPCAPPQLNLRAEVIDPNDFPSHKTRQRGHNHSSFSFPDSLPPPFNSWSLGQLTLSYNMEGRASSRARSVGPLERYLERLLQLEWHQLQTVQEEGTKSNASVLARGHNRPHTPLSTRLSCPKSILQCQCSFPRVFLSSLDSHAAQLSGCSCTACRTLYTSCCRSHGLHRHSRFSLLQEPRSLDIPPKRSYSESRACSWSARAQRHGSTVRGNNHLKHMQALGNIRNPVQRHTNSNSQSAVKDTSVGTERELGCKGGHDTPKDHRQVGLRISCSEQRRGGSERKRGGSECLRGRSEQRRSGSERRRAAVSERQELKPDVIGAIVDHLLASKNATIVKPNGRLKHVEFVTK